MPDFSGNSSQWRLFWIGACLAVFFISLFVLTQSLIALIYFEWNQLPLGREQVDAGLVQGDLVMFASGISAMLCSAIVYLVVRCRLDGIQVNSLIFNLSILKMLPVWLVLIYGFSWLASLAGEMIGKADVHSFVLDVFRTSSYPWGLVISLVVLVPFFEEYLFRGLLLEAWQASVIGTVGAVVLTSTLWSLIHFQYGWFEWIIIFLLGVLLSFARYKTGSLWTPICLHGFFNGLACYQGWS